MSSPVTSASSEGHLHDAPGAEGGSEGAGEAEPKGRTEDAERSERREGAEGAGEVEGAARAGGAAGAGGVEGAGEVEEVEAVERIDSARGADTATAADAGEEGAAGALSHKSSPDTSGSSLSAMPQADAADVDSAGISKNGHLDTEHRIGVVPLSRVGEMGTDAALQRKDAPQVGVLPPVSSLMTTSQNTPSSLPSDCRAALPPQFTLPAIQLGHIAAPRPDVPVTQCKGAGEAAVTAEEGSGAAHTLAVGATQLKTEAQGGVPSSTDPVAMDVEQGQPHAVTAPSASLRDSTSRRTVGSNEGHSTGASDVFERCSETFGLTRTSALLRIDHTAAELYEHSMHMFFAAPTQPVTVEGFEFRTLKPLYSNGWPPEVAYIDNLAVVKKNKKTREDIDIQID